MSRYFAFSFIEIAGRDRKELPICETLPRQEQRPEWPLDVRLSRWQPFLSSPTCLVLIFSETTTGFSDAVFFYVIF